MAAIKALLCQGELGRYVGDYGAAQKRYEQALSLMAGMAAIDHLMRLFDCRLMSLPNRARSICMFRFRSSKTLSIGAILSSKVEHAK